MEKTKIIKEDSTDIVPPEDEGKPVKPVKKKTGKAFK